jgi:hypothetical protein
MKGLIFRNGCAVSSLIKLSKPLELTVACVQKGCLRGTTHGYGLPGMWRWVKGARLRYCPSFQGRIVVAAFPGTSELPIGTLGECEVVW